MYTHIFMYMCTKVLSRARSLESRIYVRHDSFMMIHFSHANQSCHTWQIRVGRSNTVSKKLHPIESRDRGMLGLSTIYIHDGSLLAHWRREVYIAQGAATKILPKTVLGIPRALVLCTNHQARAAMSTHIISIHKHNRRCRERTQPTVFLSLCQRPTDNIQRVMTSWR